MNQKEKKRKEKERDRDHDAIEVFLSLDVGSSEVDIYVLLISTRKPMNATPAMLQIIY